MEDIIQFVETGCIVGPLVACAAAAYLWLVN